MISETQIEHAIAPVSFDKTIQLVSGTVTKMNESQFELGHYSLKKGDCLSRILAMVRESRRDGFQSGIHCNRFTTRETSNVSFVFGVWVE